MRRSTRTWPCIALVFSVLATIGAGAQTSPPGAQVYIVDSKNGRIVRISDMSGAGWVTLGTTGEGEKQFAQSGSIVVDVTEHIYVADTANSRMVRINDMTGAGWITFGRFGFLAGQFNTPVSVSVDARGRIYVADSAWLLGADVV